MGLLPWSFGFLFAFSLLLWAQVKTITESSLIQTMAVISMDAVGEEIGIIVEQHLPAKKNGESHGSHRNREYSGIRTTKLHLKGFFQGEGDETQKIIFQRLLAILYGNQPIFNKGDNTAAILELFEKVCKKGAEFKKNVRFSKFEDLAHISLRDDPLIQNKEHSIYYHILRGGKGKLLPDTVCNLESLQNYVSLHQNAAYIMSVYSAPKKLLLALFGPDKEEVVNELLHYRQDLYKEFRKEKGKNKEELAQRLKEKYAKDIPSDINIAEIDFNVSSTKPQDVPKPPRSLRRFNR